jgi:cyclophilin family peptidyl-prolyl cis-trans isomerase
LREKRRAVKRTEILRHGRFSCNAGIFRAGPGFFVQGRDFSCSPGIFRAVPGFFAQGQGFSRSQPAPQRTRHHCVKNAVQPAERTSPRPRFSRRAGIFRAVSPPHNGSRHHCVKNAVQSDGQRSCATEGFRAMPGFFVQGRDFSRSQPAPQRTQRHCVKNAVQSAERTSPRLRFSRSPGIFRAVPGFFAQGRDFSRSAGIFRAVNPPHDGPDVVA